MWENWIIHKLNFSFNYWYVAADSFSSQGMILQQYYYILQITGGERYKYIMSLSLSMTMTARHIWERSGQEQKAKSFRHDPWATLRWLTIQAATWLTPPGPCGWPGGMDQVAAWIVNHLKRADLANLCLLPVPPHACWACWWWDMGTMYVVNRLQLFSC